MRLTKAQLHERLELLRDLAFNEDPAGLFPIMAEAPRDEYDCLVGPLLSLLERGASEHEIAKFLESTLKDHFGVADTSYARAFARRVKSSYDDKWPRETSAKGISE
jgi:hypothetical protein